jgi:monoamine oxidase
MKSLNVGIIGGGPGGLMTAYLLETRTSLPCTITLFEASNRLGGKIVSRRFDKEPILYEAGAAELYDYSHLGPDPLRELVAELGLTTSPMQGQTVVLGDRVLKDLHDIRRELGAETARALKRFNRRARSLISPAEYYESDWQVDRDDPLSNNSFRALLARVPDEAARRYIEVAVHSDLATEPHQTSAMYGLQNYLINEPEYMRLYSIEGGIERLPQELARRLRARVLLNHPVVRVERAAEDRYRVVARHRGEVRSEEFDFVVVALPNNWIPAVEWGGALADAMHRHHAFYDYPAHYLRVSILFDRPFWRERIAESYFMLDAFGGCCVYDESSRNVHGTFGVLGWLLAGQAALSLSNTEDAVLVEQMLDSLPRCLRHGRQHVLEGHVHRWVGAVNGLPGGRPLRDPEVRHQPEPQQHPDLFVVGDYLFDSTLNGVLDSAEFVVEWIEEEAAAGYTVPANGTANGTAAHARVLPVETAVEPRNGKPAPQVAAPVLPGTSLGGSLPPYPVQKWKAS